MFILLFLFWILINGKITLEIVLVGLVVCGLVYAFAHFFFNFSFKRDLYYFKNLIWLVVYMGLLLIEVIKSNLNIITLIWSKKEADPKIVHFKVDLKSNFLRVLYANAITLTPGTITINLKSNEYTVHALRYEYADGIDNSHLIKILKKMEEKD